MTQMSEQEAKAKIQAALAEMNRILNEDVLPLAREHKVEFRFLDLQYHLFPNSDRNEMEVYSKSLQTYQYVPRPAAKEGLLVADDEWHSSSFGCSSRYWRWHDLNWPSTEVD